MTQRRAEAEPEQPAEPEQEAVPKLPRGRFLSRMAVADLFRIGMFAALLVVVVMMRDSCSNAIGNFFNLLDEQPGADAGLIGVERGGSGGAGSDAGEPASEIVYERLTPEQIRERFGKEEPEGDAGATGADAGR